MKMSTHLLDTSPALRRDAGRIGASLDRLSDQLRDGWRQAKKVRLPATYRRVTSIALCGMGGSHLGGDILRSALAERLRIPLTIIADYGLPAWVDRRTLVICSSYSGSTEETLAAMRVALRRKAKVVVVTSGGALAREARRHRLPCYEYDPTENPSAQPRLGVAYGMMAMLMCWRKLHLVKVGDTEITRLETVAWEATRRFGFRKPTKSNPAKQLAVALSGKVPFLIGAEWTAGNLHSLVNQIHENAKTYADYRLLPDLNHHLLEGLRNRAVTKQLHLVMVFDRQYHPRTQLRFGLTRSLVRRLGAGTTIVVPRGTTTLERAIDLLAFGGYVSWFLAALRRVNPAGIPTVDELKQRLAKSSLR